MARDLSLPALREAYRDGGLTPSKLLDELYPQLLRTKESFVAVASLPDLKARCRYLEGIPAADRHGLWGIPFAVKDNIDALPFPTTAACPAFEYQPTASAPAVQALVDEGALLVGKTNMDQFAAGLVGTRTPYGTARNAFDDRFIPGGSSSGSGALVGAGLVSFALGTDTAGSGRVPAMLNGCVGIKPTVGYVSSKGVVPACRSLDCISCFSRTVSDGAAVVEIMAESCGDVLDPCWRQPPHGHANRNMGNGLSNGHASKTRHDSFRFGIPDSRFLQFTGPGGQALADEYQAAFTAAVERMIDLGGQLVKVDFAPFCNVASMLYNSAFVAERFAGIRAFLEESSGPDSEATVESDPRMERVTASIIAAGAKYSAADVFTAFAELSVLQAKARAQIEKVDVLMVPTVLQHFLVAEIEAEEKAAQAPTWGKNTLSGRFTNFVNLLDMAAVSVPSSLIRHPDLSATPCKGEVAARAQLLRATGCCTPNLPFGVTLIGRAWSDAFLWGLAGRMHASSGLGCGPEGHGVEPFHRD